MVHILGLHEIRRGQIYLEPFWDCQIAETVDSMLISLLIYSHMDREVLGMEVEKNGLLSESEISMCLTYHLLDIVVDCLLEIKCT